MARHCAVFPDDEAVHLDAARLDVFGVDAVIALQRVRHDEDLAGERRIGERFLIAGHCRGEHDFAMYADGCTKRVAAIGRAILEHE